MGRTEVVSDLHSITSDMRRTASRRGPRSRTGADMNVADIMTRDVITVSATTSIPAAARLMVDHGVSGLPVVGQGGALVGIITEGDLIVRQKARPLTRRSRWALFFADPEGLARDYQRAAGTTVGE